MEQKELESKIKSYLEQEEPEYFEGAELYQNHPAARKNVVINLEQRHDKPVMHTKLIYELEKLLGIEVKSNRATVPIKKKAVLPVHKFINAKGNLPKDYEYKVRFDKLPEELQSLVIEKGQLYNSLDRIRSWLNDPDASDLSETDKEIYNRWDYAYDQLKLEKLPVVVNRLMLKFNVSKTQAYRDLQNCQKLLNPINRRELDWLRNFIVDDALLQIKVARDRLDLKAWEKARADLIKIYAIEKEDNKGIDPELLGGNEYFITINFGDKAKKINMDALHKMPVNMRVELTDFLFQDIDVDDAKFILES